MDRWSRLEFSLLDENKQKYKEVKNELFSCIDEVTPDFVKEMQEHIASNHDIFNQQSINLIKKWKYEEVISRIVDDLMNHDQVEFINEKWELNMEEYSNAMNKNLLEANKMLLSVCINNNFLKSEEDLEEVNPENGKYELIEKLKWISSNRNSPDNVFLMLQLFDRVIPKVFSNVDNRNSYTEEMLALLRESQWYDITNKQFASFLEFCSHRYVTATLEEKTTIYRLILWWI